jgi:pyridoxamine 5'-phosphate oxidase
MNPTKLITQDRMEARKLGDANADLCFLALADSAGRASIRTLVLREITQNNFTIFINQTSPKWELFSKGADYELLLWYPSLQHQYRIRGSAETMRTEIVAQNWLRRPQGSKYLDYVYKEFAPQSSPLSSRAALVEEVQRLKEVYKADNMQAPPEVAGITLIASQIEFLDLNREDRIHSRQLFNLKADTWQVTELVP